MMIDVHVPEFKGSSYVEHNITSVSYAAGLDIELSFATKSPDGLLLYADSGQSPPLSWSPFLQIFLDGGILKFAFSCGRHDMIFVQSSSNVSTGLFTAVSVE